MSSIFYDVKIRFYRVYCTECGETGHAEPYLWIIYFLFDGTWVTGEVKVEEDQDGDTVFNCYLEKASQSSHYADVWPPVVWDMGDSYGHGNIGGNMGDGDVRRISFEHKFGDLTPISLYLTDSHGNRSFHGYFKGFCGAMAILMEQDNTDDQIILNAYNELRHAVQDALDDYLDNFKLDLLAYADAVAEAEMNGDPPPEIVPDSDISRMKTEITRRVRARIEDDVKAAGAWESIKNFTDPDETLGSQVWLFDSDDLEEFAGNRMTGVRHFESDVWNPRTLNPFYPVGSRYNRHGIWHLHGSISAKKLTCFIATAAYGSPIAPQVNFLRFVRDRVLKKTKFGSLFVDAYEWIYYKFSPQVAVVMEQHRRFKTFMKWILVNPIVYFLIGVFRPFHKRRN